MDALNLREYGVPTRIDLSGLSKKFNGVVTTEVLIALRFTRLVEPYDVGGAGVPDLRVKL